MGLVTLMTSTNYNSLGNDINLVGTFSAEVSSKLVDKYVSPPLVNYVEPYEYQGVEKTLFYTEVNTNIKEGERVFIINGNYDSAEKIKVDKYKKGTDGYKVLFVDRCRIVLDIDYTGELPNAGGTDATEVMSDYIRIYPLDSYDTFVTANKQLTTRGGYIGGRFDFYQNNIAFIDSDYPSISDGWTRTSGVTASPGFYVREPGYDPNSFFTGTYKGSTWVSITDLFMTGSYSYASSYANPSLGLRHFNNGKILVMENDFTYNGQVFKAWNTYYWNSTTGVWEPEIKQPKKASGAIITRGNFRDGNFSGTFNNGVYGSKTKRIAWTGDGKWYGGTLFNTSWVSGPMFSRISLPESFQTTIGKDRFPLQRQNTFNNGGYGFNFILESEFEATSVYSAIVRNTRFGMTPSLPVVENYVLSQPTTFEQTITNGLFESCDFNNTKLIGGAVKNSRSRNTLMTGVKHINSWGKNVVIEKSTIIADSIIKIDSYDEWTASERRNSLVYGATFSDDIDFKVYKFYIGEADYLKLKSKDSFYIKGVKIANDPELLNFFDRKFTLGTWVEYTEGYNATSFPIGSVQPEFFYKRGINCAAFLSTPEENEWIYSSVRYEVPVGGKRITKGFITDTVAENLNQKYSIDIFVSLKDLDSTTVEGLNFNYATQSVSSMDYIPNRKITNKIDVTGAYIIDSSIEAGIIESCDWNSGYNIENNRDLIITKNLNDVDVMYYDVTPDKLNGTITVNTQGSYNNIEILDRDSKIYESDIKQGDIIFISSFNYYSKGKVLAFTLSSTGSNYPNSSSTSLGMSYSKYAEYNDGYGLTVDFISDGSSITDFIIDKPGIDYKVGDVLYLGLPGQGSNHSSGTGIDASITITEVDETGSVILPDSWKVLQYTPPSMTLEPLYGKDIIKGLTTSGFFISRAAKNRWYGFGRTKISSSRIKSGIFKRSHLLKSNIESENYDSSDKDFKDMDKIKSLVLSDMVFSDTGNYMSLATYYNSSLVGGTDTWNDGIIYRSVLNNMDFNRGIIRQSSWLNGNFNGGIFYRSNSYDARPTAGKEFYNMDRIISHYKGGVTLGTGSNDRYSWRKGNFNGGEFVKSDWEFGRFNGGIFYGSKWYDGIANGGIFGNETTATNDTVFYSGIVNNTTVNNARFVADDTSKLGFKSSIVWNNGTFNGGQFGSITNKWTTATSLKNEKWSSTILNHNFDLVTRNINVDIDVLQSSLITQLSEINVYIDFSANPVLMVKNLEIRLQSPKGKNIVLKEVGYGEGNEMKGTIFSSNSELGDMSTGAYPYKGKYRFRLGDSVYLPSTLSTDTTDIADLVDPTDYLKGIWRIGLFSTSLAAVSLGTLSGINVTLKASIEFVPTPQNTTIVENTATWNDGTFNGGQFIDYGVWKNGKFNGGKFLSTYGWAQSGLPNQPGLRSEYAWQNGEFNGGEFGNSSKGANSTWYIGEFNDGTFNGRKWNNGVFRYGVFNGSGLTATGGWTLETLSTSSYANDFVQSFNTNFYGLWVNGTVTDAKDVYVDSTNKKLGGEQVRATNQGNSTKTANFNNVLWSSGTFNSNVGYMNNSVFLSGDFRKGYFTDGTFNPYTNRGGSSNKSFSDPAVWNDGTFNSGDFFYSDWERGTFVSGTALGMWFKDGTSYYMNAYNVVWGSTTSYPVWKNGNWFGSEFKYLGGITDPLQQAVINKTHLRNRAIGQGIFDGGNTRMHIWNVFEDLSAAEVKVLSITASTILTYVPGFIPTDATKIFYPPVVW